MKILLTGATGFLGGHLAQALVKDEHQIVALKRRSSDHSSLAALGETIKYANMEDGLDLLFATHEDIELIIHAATSYGNRGESTSEVLMTNVLLPLQLLEKSQQVHRCPFINTDTFFCKANDDYSYLANYTLSKKMFYLLGRGFAETHQRAFINIRLEHVYGPNDGPKKFTSGIIREMIDNVPEIKLTEGEQVRDFVYVDDVVNAYLKIIGTSSVMGAKGPMHFEVGCGPGCSIRDFVITAHRIIGSRSQLVFGALPYRPNELMSSKADLKTLLELGWKSEVTMEQGIRNVISSMKLTN